MVWTLAPTYGGATPACSRISTVTPAAYRARMTWEYKFEQLDQLGSNYFDLQDGFNTQGAEGWEFVCIQKMVFVGQAIEVAIFKKPTVA